MAAKKTTVNGLQAGDLVKLKAGNGPKMTIETIKIGYADCVWFDTMQVFHREEIETSALKKV